MSLYNIKTGELQENIVPERAYAIEDYYDSETEKKLSRRIESQFGDFLANYLLKCDKEISLNRKQLYLIKKFLLISVLRSIHGEEFMQVENRFYDTLQNKAKREAERQGLPYDEKVFAPPFEERLIEGETTFQYWMGEQTPDTRPQKPPREKFEPRKGKYRRQGTGSIHQVSKNVWEGRYTPTVNGKRIARNVYADSEEECEIKLKALIKEMKAEFGIK